MPDRVLVAYATRKGSTAEIAEAVGETLRARGFDVDVAAIEHMDARCVAVLREGEHTGARPGRVVFGPARRAD